MRICIGDIQDARRSAARARGRTTPPARARPGPVERALEPVHARTGGTPQQHVLGEPELHLAAVEHRHGVRCAGDVDARAPPSGSVGVSTDDAWVSALPIRNGSFSSWAGTTVSSTGSAGVHASVIAGPSAVSALKIAAGGPSSELTGSGMPSAFAAAAASTRVPEPEARERRRAAAVRRGRRASSPARSRPAAASRPAGCRRPIRAASGAGRPTPRRRSRRSGAARRTPAPAVRRRRRDGPPRRCARARPAPRRRPARRRAGGRARGARA